MKKISSESCLCPLEERVPLAVPEGLTEEDLEEYENFWEYMKATIRE